MPSDEFDLDGLLVELRQRVEQRRAEHTYPPGLEETLDEHFDRLFGSRPAASPVLDDEIRAATNALENYEYSRVRIDAGSEVPGGAIAHRAVGKVVSRQIQGVLEQAQEHAHLVARSVALLADITSALAREYDTKVLQGIEDLQSRIADQERELNDLSRKLRDVGERIPGCALDTFYDEARFTAVFRGDAEELRRRYRDLVDRFVGCEPVLEIGSGRGEFLELLRESSIDARGVEIDDRLVRTARGRGLDVTLVEGGVEYLSQLPPGSLGGLAMIQVIEHLSPQQMIDVVQLAAEKVRVGGRVVFETVNPTSLSTYARAFWVDPDHVRPVHPALLDFLFREAGFAKQEIEYRSKRAENELLQLLPEASGEVAHLNENFARLNDLLFGPEDYAIIATR